MAEIAQREFLRVDLVHGRAGIRNSAHLVRVELLPPVQRGLDVAGHRKHPQELAVIRSFVNKPAHQGEVFLSNPEPSVNVFLELCGVYAMAEIVLVPRTIGAEIRTAVAHAPRAVGHCPTVHGVPHAPDGRFPAVNFRFFNLNHDLPPSV